MSTQFVMYPDMGRMLEQQLGAISNIVKGGDTRDLKVQMYTQPHQCLVVFDTVADQVNGDNRNLGLIDAKSIAVRFSFGKHEGEFEFTERRSDSMQFLRRQATHVQRFEVPRGCIGTRDAHWQAFCLTSQGRCDVGRVEVTFGREGPEDAPVRVPLVPFEAFVQARMDVDGEDYFEVLDWFEVPTPPHRMVFDPARCLMHFRFRSTEPEKTAVSWLPNRQGIRVDVREVDGRIVAKKTTIVTGCGVKDVTTDMEATQNVLEDGSRKLLVRFRKVDFLSNPFNDTVTLPQIAQARPETDFDYYNEDQREFADFFADKKVIGLDHLLRVRMDPEQS